MFPKLWTYSPFHCLFTVHISVSSNSSMCQKSTAVFQLHRHYSISQNRRPQYMDVHINVDITNYVQKLNIIVLQEGAQCRHSNTMFQSTGSYCRDQEVIFPHKAFHNQFNALWVLPYPESAFPTSSDKICCLKCANLGSCQKGWGVLTG